MNKKGFTLIEIMIVIAIIGILAATVFGVFKGKSRQLPVQAERCECNCCDH